MGRLEELDIDTMKYPYGRCKCCGEAFSAELLKRDTDGSYGSQAGGGKELLDENTGET